MSTVGKGFDKYGIREKIDIQALLSMIENNGGAKGLDLSGRDLSGIRLSPKVLYQIRDERKILERPIWQNENGGINLEGINLSWASLARADLSEGCLRYADLRGSELVEVDFIDTDLRDAIFWDARCDSAVFDGAYLHGAEIFGARFLDSTLCRENVGERIIQEYPTYTLPKDMKPMTDERNRFWQASKIYRHLKATFDGSGLYSDASWAYRRARRMEKYRARVYAIDSWKKKDRKASIKYLSKYITDVFVELLADYGESLFRVFFWVVFTWFGFAISVHSLKNLAKSRII